MNIHTDFFKSYKDFQNKINEYNCSKIYKGILYRASIVVGTSKWNVYNRPLGLLKWRLQNIKTFLDFSGPYIKFKNLEYLEQSEKTSIMYFMGMIFAQYNAHYLMGIRFLFHLNNRNSFHYERYGDKKSAPDLCGRDKNKIRAYLIEAKGTSQNKIYGAKKAKEQLDNIQSITFKDNNSRYFKKYLKKTISVVSAKDNSDVKTTLIDPDKTGKTDLELDSDLLIFDYYSNIFWCLYKNDSTYENCQYIKIDLDENITVGLRKEIFYLLYSRYKYDEELKSVSGLYDEINEILSEYDYKDIDDYEVNMENLIKKNIDILTENDFVEMNGIIVDIKETI